MLWHEMAMGRTITISSAAPKLSERVGGQWLMRDAKTWCWACPEPGRSDLLERIQRSPRTVSRSVCDIAEKLNRIVKIISSTEHL